MLLPRAEPFFPRMLAAKSHSQKRRHDFVHGRCCLRRASPPTKQASKPSLPLRTLDDTTPTPTPTPFTLRNTASAFISLVTTTLLPPKNCNRSHIDPTTRLLILRRAHTHATCALPRQQHRPPWGAKLAIHHHPPFLRRIARL